MLKKIIDSLAVKIATEVEKSIPKKIQMKVEEYVPEMKYKFKNVCRVEDFNLEDQHVEKLKQLANDPVYIDTVSRIEVAIMLGTAGSLDESENLKRIGAKQMANVLLGKIAETVQETTDFRTGKYTKKRKTKEKPQ